MKKFYCLSLVAVLFTASLAGAGEKTSEDKARQFTDDFVGGNMQALLDHASPELKALMKDVATMRAMRAGSVGDKAVSVGEQVECIRLMKSADGKTWSITATVADGHLIGFSVRPASDNLTPKK